MNQSKKVSIIMGIYNCSATLNEAIDSILKQTYQNWEFIICDDGSKDDSLVIAQRYEELYPDKFVILKNEKNMGLNYTLNHCLQAVTGDYVARMDGDDISVPHRFEKQVEFLNSHLEYAIVSSPMIMFDEAGKWGQTKVIGKPQIIDFVYHTPFFCHAACMVRREAYEAVSGYTVDPKLIRFEDCNLWFKMYSKGYRGYNLTEPLYLMRDDRAAQSRRKFKVRMRGVYVKYIGFKLVNMPKRYYFALVVEFLKCLAIGIVPSPVYKYMHKRKQQNDRRN
ncbi:MAG: glycosyltransferase [Clostridia bacterium]|nr:glycosyltransferase [Clostridia bacterium]